MEIKEAIKILKEVSSVRINAKSARTAILTIDEVHKALQTLISFVENSPAIDEGKLEETLKNILSCCLKTFPVTVKDVKDYLVKTQKQWLKEGGGK